MPRDTFLTFGAPVIEQSEIDEVVACLRSGWIGTGRRAGEFEQAFHEYKGSWGHALAVNSGTAALHIALTAAGLEPGDEVVTTPLTFCATVNAIIHAGLTPVLADVDPVTMNIDPAAVEAAITPRTRAILPVHFGGRACDMDALQAIARRRDLRIVEDCAHAIETIHRGRAAGTLGDFGCFSFYATKNVTTAEGGMILVRDPAEAARCRTLALHGLTHDAWTRYGDGAFRHYEVVACGFKYNLTDLAASIGLHQLRRVEHNWSRRAAIWAAYTSALQPLPLTLPAPPDPDTRHAHHLFTIRVRPDAPVSRDVFIAEMAARRIGTGVHYRSIPEHVYYAERFGWKPEAFPHAMTIGRETVSLPLSAGLSAGDIADVLEAAHDVLG
jgi:dTDP-4-amino-4,6-dideoxygalactose transaminase